VHPAWREFRDELSATVTRIIAYLGVLAVIAVTFLLIITPPDADSDESTSEPVFRSDWATVGRPFRAFALSMPEFTEPNPDYAIQRHASGGGRRDIMNWGGASNEGERSRLMIEIYRPGEEIGDFGDAASEVAIRTAALGGPYPLQQAPEIESKFGAFDSFDFVASPNGAPRQCLGFMRAFAEPRLAITGWHCRAALEIVDRSVIACALERLSLVMAASEPKLTELFARAERQRKPCGQKPGVFARLSNTLAHDWLAAPAMPKLRGHLATK
jgi:hypothetical protein